MKFLQTLVCALALPVTVLAQSVVTGTVADTAGAPLAGVHVSDGHTIATTDALGRYTLSTPLDLGYVFVSTPDGYEPATRLGNRPCFWQSVGPDAAVADFVLEKLPAQRPLAVIAVADPQISNRCDDVRRLRELYVPDINRSVDSLRTAGLEPIVRSATRYVISSWLMGTVILSTVSTTISKWMHLCITPSATTTTTHSSKATFPEPPHGTG